MADAATLALETFGAWRRAHPYASGPPDARLERLYPGTWARACREVPASYSRIERSGASNLRRPLTTQERHILSRLAKCSLSPQSALTRIVRELHPAPEGATVTERQAEAIQAAGHTYRKQLRQCLATNCPTCRAKETTDAR